MRPRDDLAELEDPVEIAATWGDLFFSGRVDAMDWLTMRTCTVDLSGTASEADPLDRAGVCSYSRTLEQAFEEIAWRVGRVEQREHEIRLDASLEARHTGPLDLSAFGGPTYEATGRMLRLPLQRLRWTIAHKRVLRFEIERGPGLGPRFLARELELTPTVSARKRPARPPRCGTGTEASSGEDEEGSARGKPSIEDLIDRAHARTEDDEDGVPRGR